MYNRAAALHESYFQHKCTVTTDKDVLVTDIRGRGWGATLQRWWHDWFLLSYSDERCRVYYASSEALRLDRARHFRRYRGRIHPLSKFSNTWEIIILLVSITNRLVFHHNTSISFGRLLPVTHIIGVVMECILCIALIVHLKTGYIDDEQRIIVLDRRKGVIHYCSTKLLFHVLAALPLQSIMLLRYGLDECSLCRGNKFTCTLQFLSLFALIRLYGTTQYLNRTRTSFTLTYFYKLLRIFVLASVTMLQYLNILDAINVWLVINSQEIAKQSKFHYQINFKTFEDQSTIMYICIQFSMICKCLFRYDGGHEPMFYLDTLTSLLGFIMANIFRMWAFVEWYTVVHRKRSKSTRLIKLGNMTTDLMKARQVSDEVCAKVKGYYKQAISSTAVVSKRNELYTVLPSSIKKEIKLSCYLGLVKLIPYFSEWPLELVEELVNMLKEEVYLPQDIVAPKLSQGDGLMILSSGVLAVYSEGDEEVGHLIDGSYFGELSLVTDRELRTSSVIAVTPCEVLLLCKKAFRSYMRRYPTLFLELRETMRTKFYKHSNGDGSAQRQQQKSAVGQTPGAGQRPENSPNTSEDIPTSNASLAGTAKSGIRPSVLRVKDQSSSDDTTTSSSRNKNHIRWREEKK